MKFTIITGLGIMVASAGLAASASAQTYTLTDISPPEALESVLNGAGSSQAVGQISVPHPDAPFPDARRTYAVVWDQTTGTWTSLDPGAEYSGSYGFRARNGQQVGFGFISGPNLALLWTGTGSSAVVLNSPGVESAVAYDTDGTTQIGASITPDSAGGSWAWVWTGTAESGRSIHPVGLMNTSIAQSIRDGRIVGTGDDLSEMRAGLYWASADAQAVIVRPDGFDETFLSDIAGAYAFGDGSGGAVGGQRHAVLFPIDDLNGDAWIDLHPSDPAYLNSYSAAALRTGPGERDFTLVGSAAFIVDAGTGETYEHACVWLPPATSGGQFRFVDLHALVPAGFVLSVARGIDDAGNIYGWATDLQGRYLALRWSPVGEPTCPADFNGDGFIDFFDYGDYVEAFETGDPRADFNDDAFIDFFDYSDFVEAFETGC